MANPEGRPSRYNAEMQEKADSYIDNLDELKHCIPSRAGLCCFLGIARSTSYEWEASYPDFSDTLAKIDVLQEHLTLNGGMVGKFNSTIAKLVLANHGYSDKKDDGGDKDDLTAILSKLIDKLPS